MVESHYRGLVAIGVEKQMYSGIVVLSILEKLPDTLRLTITRGGEYLEWNLGDLLHVLLKEVELREDYSFTPQVHPNLKGYRRKKLPPQTNSFLMNNGSRTDGQCAFCLGEHPHEDCKRITNIEERKQLIRKFGRCYKCLDKGHLARDCTSKITCKNSKGNHHVSLCERKTPQTSGGSGALSTGSAASAPNTMLVGQKVGLPCKPLKHLLMERNREG